MAEGKYEQAIAIFTELGDYKDCMEQLAIAKIKLQYEDACEKIKAEEYEQAVELLKDLDYLDSENLYLECCEVLYKQKIIEATEKFNGHSFVDANKLFLEASVYATDQQAANISSEYAKISEFMRNVRYDPDRSFFLDGIYDYPLAASDSDIVGVWSISRLGKTKVSEVTFTSDHKYVDFYDINMGEYWSLTDGVLQLDIWKNKNFNYYKVYKASPEVLIICENHDVIPEIVAVMWKDLDVTVILGN
jgi:hypothetical protein